jgi:Tol biopolymer transport system component
VVGESSATANHPVVDTSGVLFYSVITPDGLYAIYRKTPDALAPTVVADKVAGPGWFAISPDGRFVVFTRAIPPFSLIRVNSDGSGRTTLVQDDAVLPSVTPDGTTVLFEHNGPPGLMAVPLKGGAVKEAVPRVVGRFSVSPDGRRLLFITDKPGIVALCDLPACLAPRELPMKGCRWTPDGLSVAYIDPVSEMNIWTQPLDGGPPSQLTHFTDRQIQDFGWSADGKQLAVARGTTSSDIVLLTGLR